MLSTGKIKNAAAGMQAGATSSHWLLATGKVKNTASGKLQYLAHTGCWKLPRLEMQQLASRII